jgi:prolyl-tRNA editing enzyme YbaK/EbsC (Cys-tRNA(Pro) deacylase)
MVNSTLKRRFSGVFMSTERVRNYLKNYNLEARVQEFECSSATVELAAAALKCEEARIAKTISFSLKEGQAILIVTAGDTRIDNKKYKKEFGLKAKMLNPTEVKEFTGYEVGGVCPFDIREDVLIYLDKSMQRFDSIFPAAGTDRSAVELTCDELFTVSKSKKWIDVCSFRG